MAGVLAGIVVTLQTSATAATEPQAPAAAVAPGGGSACSTAVRRRRAAALRRYQRRMPAARRAYFRRHRSPRARRAFVRRQQVQLKRLRRSLAACSQRERRRADLSIAFTGTPPPVGSSRRLTYRVTATNRGSLRVAEVNILVARPPGTAIVSASGPAGERCGGDSVASCDVGALAPGQSKTITVVLRTFAGGRVSVEAEVLAYDADDPNEANNRTISVVELRPPTPSCPPVLWPGFNAGLLSEGDLAEDHIGHTSQGTASALMVFVDFSDAAGTEATADLYQRYAPEAERMFSEVSYGRFGLSVTPHHRWLRMPRPSSQYLSHDLIGDALAALDAEIDFRRFSIVYAVAPRESAVRTWAYVSDRGHTVDGVAIRHGAIFGGDSRADAVPHYSAHVLVHETGHTFALPDLYEQPPATGDHVRFVGIWDPMSSVTPIYDFFAWHKWKLGWLDASQVGCLAGPGVVEETLTPVAVPGGVKAIVALTGPSTAFVAEARRRAGADSTLCEEGVVVYSVDAAVGTGRGPVRVRPAQPDGASLGTCGTLYEAPFDVGPDEVATFEDGAAGVTVEVLASLPEGYRVRVTKR